MKISNIIKAFGLTALLFGSQLEGFCQIQSQMGQSQIEICGPESEVVEIKLAVSGTNVRIENAQGQKLEVYDITGVHKATCKIDSDDKTVNLNLQKGCYLLKVGNVVRKINLR